MCLTWSCAQSIFSLVNFSLRGNKIGKPFARCCGTSKRPAQCAMPCGSRKTPSCCCNWWGRLLFNESSKLEKHFCCKYLTHNISALSDSSIVVGPQVDMGSKTGMNHFDSSFIKRKQRTVILISFVAEDTWLASIPIGG